jgi:hypothetical protein
VSVFARRLIGPVVLNSADTLIYTVPAGRTAVIRHISVFNGDASGHALRLRATGSGAGTIIMFSPVIGSNAELQVETHIYLNPGDALYCGMPGNASAGSCVTFFGALLVGAPV